MTIHDDSAALGAALRAVADDARAAGLGRHHAVRGVAWLADATDGEDPATLDPALLARAQDLLDEVYDLLDRDEHHEPGGLASVCADAMDQVGHAAALRFVGREAA